MLQKYWIQHKFEIGPSKISTGLQLRLKVSLGPYNESFPITALRSADGGSASLINQNVIQINYDWWKTNKSGNDVY